MRRGLIAAWCIIFLVPAIYASDRSPQFHYPELMVVPSASESLERFAKQGSPSWLSIQIPASLNLLAGIVMFSENPSARDNDPHRKVKHSNTANAASVVSAAWLGLGFGLNLWYQPYQIGWREVARLPAGTERERLIRERIAEQHLAAPSRVARILTHAFAASQAAISLAVLKNSTTDEAKVLAGLGGISAISPYLFPLPWISKYEQHRLYKKRIYSPISAITIDHSPDGYSFSQIFGYQVAF